MWYYTGLIRKLLSNAFLSVLVVSRSGESLCRRIQSDPGCSLAHPPEQWLDDLSRLHVGRIQAVDRNAIEDC